MRGQLGGTGAASIAEATVMVGSFMFDFDTQTMVHCLKVPSEKFRDKLRQGDLDEREVEIQVSASPIGVEIMAPPGMEEMTSQLQGLFLQGFSLLTGSRLVHSR